MKNKRNAFTFAELMVSLVIIAVITALLYPTISEISPNNNKQLFRSAYKTIELTAQDIIDSNEDISDSNKLCNAFKDRLNTVSWTDTTTHNGCTSGEALQELHTSNGMRWWFQNIDGNTHTLYIDVNAANNGNSGGYLSQSCDSGCTGNKADPNNFCNGAGSPIWTHGCFRNNNSTIRDTFKILITTDGKVDPTADDQGARHLRDETN